MAAVCVAVAAWLIYNVTTATESPSSGLAILQYVLIAGALVGLLGAVRQIMKA
jgi:hypothetical protein